MTEAFGSLLKTIRKQRHMTQQALAHRLGVHRNTISAWECGEWLPTAHVLEMAELLGCSRDETRTLLQAALMMP